MSIWGKIIGGTAGFALGGPLGALAGAIAGHTVDIYTTDKDHDRQVAFSIALIALSAKMAKADGVVSRDEILAFREKIDIAPKDIESVGKIWDIARQTPDGFEGYAMQVAKLFPQAPAVLEGLMGLLFHIAQADGAIDTHEDAYLRRVATLLGFDEQAYQQLAYTHGDQTNPYRILGVNPDCDQDELRKAWIAMSAKHHPDKLIAQGLPEECIRAANDRIAIINNAYESLRQ